MNFLLDTCVISELMKRTQHLGVMRWLDAQASHSLFLSALTLGELEQGIEQLPVGERRRAYERITRQALPARFAGRVLPVDAHVAGSWGTYAGRHKQTLPVVDGLIAATARVHGLTVATRNVADFRRFDVPVFDPWS